MTHFVLYFFITIFLIHQPAFSSSKRDRIASRPQVKLKKEDKLNLQKIQQKLQSLQSSKIKFHQKIYANEEVSSISEGYLAIGKPDRLRFEIDTPQDLRSVIVANQKEAKVYTPGLMEDLPGSLQIMNIENNPAKIWFSLFNGNFKEFVVDSITSNSLSLYPRRMDMDVERVDVKLNSSYLIELVTIIYKLGNRTEIKFTSYDFKSDMKNAFELKVPKNTFVKKR